MALDRQHIERKDFPIGRRGYETDVVDAHLRRVAEELETLREEGAGARPAGGETLAVAASEQVRTIVEAAERSAGDIQRQAEDEARAIRDDAASEAERSRSDAAQEAQGHVERVSEATRTMLQRVDAMETELGALLEGLRTGANRLQADLTLLQGNMGELQTSSGTQPGTAGEAGGPDERAERRAGSEETPETDTAEEPETEAGAGEAAEPASESEPAGADAEGARLIALNMALNGSPREETDRYLAENFNLEDRDSLLDDVYSRVG